MLVSSSEVFSQYPAPLNSVFERPSCVDGVSYYYSKQNIGVQPLLRCKQCLIKIYQVAQEVYEHFH